MCFLVLLIGGKILLQYYAQKKEEKWSSALQEDIPKNFADEALSAESFFEKITKKFFLQEYNQAQVISF